MLIERAKEALHSDALGSAVRRMGQDETFFEGVRGSRGYAHSLDEATVPPVSPGVELGVMLCPGNDDSPGERPAMPRLLAPTAQRRKSWLGHNLVDGGWKEGIVVRFERACQTLVRLEKLGLRPFTRIRRRALRQGERVRTCSSSWTLHHLEFGEGGSVHTARAWLSKARQ